MESTGRSSRPPVHVMDCETWGRTSGEGGGRGGAGAGGR